MERRKGIGARVQFQNRLNSRDNLEEKSRAKRESRARPRFHRGGEALQILMGKFTVPEPVTTVHGATSRSRATSAPPDRSFREIF